MFCAAAKGRRAPFAEDDFEKTATTKAAIVEGDQRRDRLLRRRLRRATDANAGQMVAAPFGTGQIAARSALVGQIGHDNEHYGNLVTYFRIKGMVPPSSKRQ